MSRRFRPESSNILPGVLSQAIRFHKGRSRWQIYRGLCSALWLALAFSCANSQERWERIDTFRVKEIRHWEKIDNEAPIDSVLRISVDSKRHRIHMLDEVAESISIDDYVYFRPQDEREWAVASFRTLEAMGASEEDRAVREANSAALAKVVAEGNMRFTGLVRIRGKIAFRYVSIEMAVLKIGPDREAVAAATKLVETPNQRLRKVSYKILDRVSNQRLGAISADFFGYNQRIVIRAPKLRDDSEDRFEGRMFLTYAPCKQSDDRQCGANEMIIQWDSTHIRKAVAVDLTRQTDYSGGDTTKLGVFRRTKGSFRDTLCDRTVYRVFARDRNGRHIHASNESLTVPRSDILPCQ